MDLNLQNRTALVTGSHRGTGQIIAKALLAEGAQVLVHGFEPGQAEASVSEIGGGIAFTADLCNDAARGPLAELCQAYNIDILVNNYGTATPGRWQDSSSDGWSLAYQHNLMSAVRCIEAALPGMQARGWGRIINLGTVGSTSPNARMPQYYSAKGALAAMNASLAKELAGTGVRVNLVSPGLIATPEVIAAYIAKGKKAGWGETWEAVEPHVAKDIPIGRITRREEVADLVSFLASTRSDAIHGQNIRIDGGQLGIVQ
ncbi:MAG: SDR family NAD(P)-dependent oxidoreductase [Pseudomonadales bacterium]